MKVCLHYLIFSPLLRLKLSDKCVKVDNKTIYNFKMSRKDINYAGVIFKCNGYPKLWEEFKTSVNYRANYSLYITK